MASQKSSGKYLISALIIIAIGAVAFAMLNAPDNRNTAERVGDAVKELPNGVDKAADQLKDRTPTEKLGDAVDDIGAKVRKVTNRE